MNHVALPPPPLSGAATTRPRVLMLGHAYPPDPIAVGQYQASAGQALVAAGWEVTMLSADRMIDDPAQRLPAVAVVSGVTVLRRPWGSFGKKTLLHRAAGMLGFLVQASWHGLTAPRYDVVVASTAPPLTGLAGWLISVGRRVPLVWWVMDLNPDQAVASGKLRATSVPVRFANWVNRRVLRRAAAVIVLDEYMADRLRAKAPIPPGRLHVLPLWPLDNLGPRIPPDATAFRAAHGLAGKFVVMYSGNHSAVHPLNTILDAARALHGDAFNVQRPTSNAQHPSSENGGGELTANSSTARGGPERSTPNIQRPTLNDGNGNGTRACRLHSDPAQSCSFTGPEGTHPSADYVGSGAPPPAASTTPLGSVTAQTAPSLTPGELERAGRPVVFVFVGGGVGKAAVAAHLRAYGAGNVVSLPYVPLAALRDSLSAADLHVVAMGDDMVGCVHPCKFIGAFSLGIPILYLGPGESHIAPFVTEPEGAGWHVAHGDVDRAIAVITAARDHPERLRAAGERARAYAEGPLAEARLKARFEEIVAAAAGGRAAVDRDVQR